MRRRTNRKLIFDPLGLTDTAFEAPTAGNKLDRLVTLHQRAENETLTAIEHFEFGKEGGFHSGGGGLFSTVDDYLKICTILINQGVGAGGVRVLKSETIDEMYKDQISHLAPEKGLEKVIDVSIPHLGGASSIPFDGFAKGWASHLHLARFISI